MSEEDKLNYFGEGPDESPDSKTAGEEPAKPQPSTQVVEKPNPRYERWVLFTKM